jgi:hypothetical protein
MAKFTGVAYEPHPVTPERKAELRKQGLKIIDVIFAPAGAAAAEPLLSGQSGLVDGDTFSDDQLRELITEATGKAPHHKLGREKLIDQFNAINAEKSEEFAANGLTRREIEADLSAMHVDFDPADALDDLAALRDLAREQRDS